MDLGKAFSLSVVFVLLVSMVSASGAAESIVKYKCDEGSDTVDAPDGVTLNGEDVDSVECSNLENYSFPESRMVEMPTVSSGPSVQEFVLSVLLPPLLMFSSAVIISWRKALGWKRPSLFFVGAIFSFIAESGLFQLMAALNLDSSVFSLVFPLLIGLFALPLLILYRKGFGSEEARLEALVSFLFVAGINWLVLGMIFVFQSSLSTFAA